MKYAIIYKHPFHRSQSLIVDSESFDAIRTTEIDPERVFVEWVVDFENKEIIRAAMKVTGELIEVPEGDYGEQTTAEQFEQEMEIQE